MPETYLNRAARLLRDAQAEAQNGDAENALVTTWEAVYALRVELGELEPLASVDAVRSDDAS